MTLCLENIMTILCNMLLYIKCSSESLNDLENFLLIATQIGDIFCT